MTRINWNWLPQTLTHTMFTVIKQLVFRVMRCTPAVSHWFNVASRSTPQDKVKRNGQHLRCAKNSIGDN
jgi:hypothetical protein